MNNGNNKTVEPNTYGITSVSIRGDLHKDFKEIQETTEYGIFRSFSDVVIPCAQVGLEMLKTDRTRFNEILQKQNTNKSKLN